MVVTTYLPNIPTTPGASPSFRLTPVGLGAQFDTTPELFLPGAPTYSAGVADTAAGTYSGPGAGRTFAGEPFAVWVGMVALLALLGWFASHKDSLGGANPGYIKVGGYNLLTVTVAAAVGFFLLKLLFRRFQVPGISEFVAVI